MGSWRHSIVVVIFIAGVVGLCGRIVFLGVTERDFLQEQGDARSVRTETIPAMRGVIADRRGEPLAVSTPVYGVWTDPSRAQLDAAEIVALGDAIGVSAKRISERLAAYEGKEFVYLKRRLSYDDAQRLIGLKIPHVYLQPEYRRYYPAGETTAHVVGLTNLDDKGIEGIEVAFNDSLQGKRGGKVVLKDRLGNVIRDLEFLGAPVYGQDLSLSIDLTLQFTAYRELKSAIATHKAKSGSIVIADVATGEILALVNQPSYNPNAIADHLAGMRNRAVTDAYEPGSTIKPFTTIAALESGLYDRNTPIKTAPGYFRIGSKLIQDPIDRGTITLSKALQKSSQVGFAKLALDLEEKAVFDVLTRAGLGRHPGTRLPGEAAGFIDSSQLKYPIVRAAFAYGYGLSVTPVQLTQAYLALASGGIVKPLSILRDDRNKQSGERIYDASLTEEVLMMMETVTAPEGTASGAAVAGYRVAGKTGTARMVGPNGYDDERHAAWFAGIAPVSNPKIVAVVLINEPSAGVTGGGAVAAPIFARVAERSLPLLGVLPDRSLVARVSGGPT
ncbi:MAG: penicillin-binding transpeptidase domain-containing protein [Pseudomonadales bacterium]|nr:penicillin-binding transpeptidase domain-containing protein [Pseudomonadales bacterium]